MVGLKGRHILVTGSEGFIGSHLVEELLRQGAKVRAFVYYNAFNSWGWLDTFAKKELKNLDIFLGDVRDQNSVRKAMKNMDMVFHLAALIGIPFSYNAPDSYIDTNIKGTLNILQGAIQNNLERILITSTSEIYGSASHVPMKEDHPLQAQSPYSASKIGGDKIAESFFKSFHAPVTIVRPFNTYGPRQSARAVIPTIIIQLLSGKKSIRLGALEPKRDFNYVKDVCKGFIAIVRSKKTIGEEINISSGKEISIGSLADKLIKRLNPKAKIVLDMQRIRPEASEVMRLLGSNKKIIKLTNWSPEYSLDRGLDETIEWFKNKANMRIYKPEIYNV